MWLGSLRQVASRNHKLQREALEIYSMAMKGQTTIEPEWVKQEQNQQADF